MRTGADFGGVVGMLGWKTETVCMKLIGSPIAGIFRKKDSHSHHVMI